MDNVPVSGFIRLPEVLSLIPVSKSTFWAGVKNGRYPKPVKISPRCTAWRVKDILAFIQSTDPIYINGNTQPSKLEPDHAKE